MLPDLDDATPYGIPVLFNKDGSSDALGPSASVELTIDPRRVDALKRHLATSNRTLASLTRADLVVTHVVFDDGTHFSPAGYGADETTSASGRVQLPVAAERAQRACLVHLMAVARAR